MSHQRKDSGGFSTAGVLGFVSVAAMVVIGLWAGGVLRDSPGADVSIGDPIECADEFVDPLTEPRGALSYGPLRGDLARQLGPVGPDMQANTVLRKGRPLGVVAAEPVGGDADEQSDLLVEQLLADLDVETTALTIAGSSATLIPVPTAVMIVAPGECAVYIAVADSETQARAIVESVLR